MDKETTKYDKVSEFIRSRLDRGEIPWRKPWTMRGIASGDSPYRNGFTGNRYHGINVLFCAVGDWSDPRFGTFHQIKANGGHIIKGSAHTPIVFFEFKRFTDRDKVTGEETIRRVPFLRRFQVFNLAAQTTGLDLEPLDGEPAPGPDSFDPIPAAEDIVTRYRLSEGAPHFADVARDRACYIPSLDRIEMPPRPAFHGAPGYYETLYHEMAHSTGAASRLSREFGNRGTKAYAREELVAELAAAFLWTETGAPDMEPVENAAAYCANWSRNLSGDPRAFVWAASRAIKATRFILGIDVQADVESNDAA